MLFFIILGVGNFDIFGIFISWDGLIVGRFEVVDLDGKGEIFLFVFNDLKLFLINFIF